MTLIERAQKALAEIDADLALAEKTTPGPWGVERTMTTNWIGPMRRNGDGKISIIVCDTDRDGLRAECINQNDCDAKFIAASRTGWPLALRCLRTTISALVAIAAPALGGKTQQWCAQVELKNLIDQWEASRK